MTIYYFILFPWRSNLFTWRKRVFSCLLRNFHVLNYSLRTLKFDLVKVKTPDETMNKIYKKPATHILEHLVLSFFLTQSRCRSRDFNRNQCRPTLFTKVTFGLNGLNYFKRNNITCFSQNIYLINLVTWFSRCNR